MAKTIRADRIERQENITALLLDIVSAVEVLGLLLEDEDEQQRLIRILDETIALKQAAIKRRNQRSIP